MKAQTLGCTSTLLDGLQSAVDNREHISRSKGARQKYLMDRVVCQNWLVLEKYTQGQVKSETFVKNASFLTCSLNSD